MKNAQKGFTLIELMIVIAIIGILAAVALPAYQTYTAKAKFTEVIAAATPFRTAVDVAYQSQRTGCTTAALADLDAGACGIPPAAGATGEVASVTVVNGAITATSSATGGYTFILTPTEVASNTALTWAQSGTCVAAGVC